MPDPRLRRFDALALYHALDERRAERGLSWPQVAADIWALSSELNDRRRDHPIAASTLTGIAKRGVTSCQHALFMLRWLGETPERFLVDAGGAGGNGRDTGAGVDTPAARDLPGGRDPDAVALPAAGRDQRLRWDLPALADAVDAQRRARSMTWAEVAREVGFTVSQVSGLRERRFAVGIDLAMRLVQWLGRTSADFVYAARW